MRYAQHPEQRSRKLHTKRTERSLVAALARDDQRGERAGRRECKSFRLALLQGIDHGVEGGLGAEIGVEGEGALGQGVGALVAGMGSPGIFVGKAPG